ncbi:hypothetical protein AAKU52_003366 [Pedobacter sp. CG_S7]|uniref:hypothetical protein n=1 Tax=Pedobacter sp. CG_S7 TaxID=3143930 RepID=UPI00339AD630
METMKLEQLTEITIKEYIEKYNLVKFERELLDEVLQTVREKDIDRLAWYAAFGKDLRQITNNLYAYRKGLNFGFTEISFDQNGWINRAKLLDPENIVLANSEIRLGRGKNNLWIYTLDYSFGTCGSASPLTVYDKPYPDRETALNTALNELKEIMQLKVGNTDRGNYNPSIIAATITAVTTYKYKDLQMALF